MALGQSSIQMIIPIVMAMFLSDKELLKDHPKYRYSFPLEEAQDFASLILLTQKINKEIERGDKTSLAMNR
jgi:hypothetical protein